MRCGEMHVITAIIELEVNSGGSLTEKQKYFFLQPPWDHTSQSSTTDRCRNMLRIKPSWENKKR